MKDLVRSFSGTLGNFLPFGWVRYPACYSSVFPFYHIVSDEPCPHTRNLYPVCTIARFRKDIDFLLRNYVPLTFSQVAEYASTGPQKGNIAGFYLSFDDGLRECAEVIAPILYEKGIEAAFFVNPAFVDNHSLFNRHKISLLIDAIMQQRPEEVLKKSALILQCNSDEVIKKIYSIGVDENAVIDNLAYVLHVDFNRFLIEKKPYLELFQLVELQKKGFIIGSHSFDHPLFSDLDIHKMKEQVERSMDWLRQNLSFNKRVFAFPFTDDQVHSSFFNWMYGEAKIDVSFGTAGLKFELFKNHLQRIPMDKGKYNSADQILREEYVYYFVRSIFGKNKITGR